MRIESIEQFGKLQGSLASEAKKAKNLVLVCCGPGCLANGAAEILKAFEKELDGTGTVRADQLPIVFADRPFPFLAPQESVVWIALELAGQPGGCQGRPGAGCGLHDGPETE